MRMGGFFHKHNLGGEGVVNSLDGEEGGGGCQFLVDVKLALF